MNGKQQPRHALYNVSNHPEGGWSGVCTCGMWGHAGAATKRSLKDAHVAHVRATGGR